MSRDISLQSFFTAVSSLLNQCCSFRGIQDAGFSAQIIASLENCTRVLEIVEQSQEQGDGNDVETENYRTLRRSLEQIKIYWDDHLLTDIEVRNRFVAVSFGPENVSRD